MLSTSLTVGIPSGDFTDADLLYTGDGEFNQLIKAEWGYGAARWYASGNIGVNNRTKGFSEKLLPVWRPDLAAQKQTAGLDQTCRCGIVQQWQPDKFRQRPVFQ